MYLRRILAAILISALSVCAFGKKVVLGKLGQVTETTKILSKPASDSKVLYSIEAYEYIVVKPLRKTWVKVLLKNGNLGYVKSEVVATLPYNVTANQGPDRLSLRAPTAMGYRGSSRGPTNSTSASAAQYALNFVGTPYVWGGNGPNRGVDCSGLVQQMLGAIGQPLPRAAAEQVNVGRPITRLQDLQKGDRLYFWDSKRGKVGHTGIYLGGGYFVHSSRGHNGVATD